MRTLSIAVLTLVLAAIPRAQNPEYNAFVSSFDKALQYNDENGMDKAVRGAPEHALHYFSALAWQARGNPKDSIRQSMDALKASWNRTLKTATLDDIERFVLTRSDSDQNEINKIETQELGVFQAYWEGDKTHDRSMLESAAQSAVNFAKAYATLGYQIASAKMWSLAAEITLKLPDRTLDERKQALEYLRNFLARREDWHWTVDSLYLNNKNLVQSEEASISDAQATKEKRRAEGYDENVTGVEALVMPNVEPTVSDLEFEAMKREQTDMFAHGGELPGQWSITLVEGKGPNKLAYFSACELYLVRPSTNEWGIALQPVTEPQKGNYQPIEPSNKFKASVFYLDAEHTKPYAMWFLIGAEKEPKAGLLQGMERTDPLTSALVYYKNASSWRTKIADEDVTFFDDDGNGVLFEQDPLKYGLRDFTRDEQSGVPVAVFDSMQIGRGDPQPLSRFAKIGDKWYYLEPRENGTKVAARPLNSEYVKFGNIDLEWKGPRSSKPEVLVVSGQGPYANACFDIASGDPIEVPAGSYTVQFGRIENGKGVRANQALIYNGDMAPIDVKPGETTKVTMGAPFTLDFDKQIQGDEALIDSLTMRVKGAAGERYARITDPPTPEVLVAKKPGRGGKSVGEFTEWTTDSYVAAANKHKNLTLDVMFFSMPKGDTQGDTVLHVKLPFPDAVIGLRQAKHDIFGRLDPVWK